jgi:hypothetical protein
MHVSRKLLHHDAGQAAAEFGLALMVLLPLMLWMLRLGEVLNMKHRMLGAANLAVWERAYGRKETDIKKMVEADLKANILFSDRSRVKIETTLKVESSKRDFKSVSWSGVPPTLLSNHTDACYDNYYLSRIQVNGTLPLGFKYSLAEKHAMLGDPWNLADQNGDRQITNYDLAETVNRIYFWFPGAGRVTTPVINTILNTGNRILNNGVVRILLRLAGQEPGTIDPRGHPRLNQVPSASGRR